MARSSKNLDQKLIRTAAALFRKKGPGAISLREVAKKSKVNLGMFHYHFKNKDEFIQLVIAQVYQDLIDDLETASLKNAGGLEELLLSLSNFADKNAKLILYVISGLLANDPAITRFAKQKLGRHFAILKNKLDTHLQAKASSKEQQSEAFYLTIAIIGLSRIAREKSASTAKPNPALRVQACLAALATLEGP